MTKVNLVNIFFEPGCFTTITHCCVAHLYFPILFAKIQKGRLNAKYTADGLHLTTQGGGYEKWVDYLRKHGYL